MASGPGPQEGAGRDLELVSILVLVKYGLGGWPRGPASPGHTSSLNSCSGEVWPRGGADGAEGERHAEVSILVLVKYGLGDRRALRRQARRGEVSILVLVKYGLGVIQKKQEVQLTALSQF